MAGVEVQTVANALDIHPFMLSRWRKEVRDGVLRGRARRVDVPSRSAREIKQLQALKREHAMLKEEHELLKKPSGSLPNEDGNLRIHRRATGRVHPEADVRALPGAERENRPGEAGVLRTAVPSTGPLSRLCSALGGLGVVADHRGVRADLRLRKHHPELHVVSSSGSAVYRGEARPGSA